MMEGLLVAEADLTVYVHPSKANKARNAVLCQLSSLLFSYDEVFEGIILAYELGDLAERAKTLPEGKVVKLGRESIHVVVLGCCSAAIMLEDIREEFKYTTKDGVGLFSSVEHKRHSVKPGSIIRFSVKSFHEENLHISGSLLGQETGCIRWLTKHGFQEGSHDSSVLKRHRVMDTKTEVQEAGSYLSGEVERPLKRHKSKKSAHEDS